MWPVSNVMGNIPLIFILLCVSLSRVRGQDYIHGDFAKIVRSAVQQTRDFRTVSDFVIQSLDYDEFSKVRSNEGIKQVIKSSVNEAADSVSEECLNATEAVLAGLEKGANGTWAWKMIDAAGKFPSSLLRDFRLHWVGSYSECLEIVTNVTEPSHTLIQGQYCTASIPIKKSLLGNSSLASGMKVAFQIGLCMPDSCNASETQALLYGGLATVSTLIPQLHLNLSSIDLSVDCKDPGRSLDTKAIVAIVILAVFVFIMTIATVYDVLLELMENQSENTAEKDGNEVINDKNPDLDGVSRQFLKVDEYAPLLISKGNLKVLGSSNHKALVGICSRILLSFSVYTNGKKLLCTRQSAGSLSCVNGVRFLSMSWVMLGHSTVFPLGVTGIWGRILLSFSVYTNGRKLLDTHQTSESLRCVNGVRFISLSWVILGHTVVLTPFLKGSVGNLGNIPLLIKTWTFQVISNATVSVDTFFVLSGLLVTYLALKEMKKNDGKLNWIMFYVHRYWRLTPPYMLIMMVYVCILPYIGQGPLWSEQSDVNCGSWWWTNLLYINNFVHSKTQCMAWSWYLANDMQFYIISPLIILPLFKFKVLGLIVMGVLLLASMITSGVISGVNKLGPGSFTLVNNGGGDLEHMADGWVDLYIRPYTRISAYLAGMFFGYLLHKTDCKVRMNKFFVLLCWMLAAFLCLSQIYGLYDVWQGHPMSNGLSAFYNATFRFAWSMGVGWVIFACCTGYGGFVNTLLSWKAFVPLSRLTYCAYLIHPVVMFWYYNSQESLLFITDNNLMYFFLGHMVAGYSLAFVFSLMFESPMMALEKAIRNKKA